MRDSLFSRQICSLERCKPARGLISGAIVSVTWVLRFFKASAVNIFVDDSGWIRRFGDNGVVDLKSFNR